MFGLPASTEIRKPVPKTVIYEKFTADLVGNRKKSFDEDISRIVVVNEISEASVNIREGDEVKAIFAVLIELKSKEYDEKNISLIVRLFGQKLLLFLHYGEEYQIAIYQTKILHSAWVKEEEKKIRLDGLNLDSVWQSFVSQISGIVPQNERTLNEQIQIEIDKDKLKKRIIELESKAKKEVQSKKKYDYYKQIQELKIKLDALR